MTSRPARKVRNVLVSSSKSRYSRMLRAFGFASAAAPASVTESLMDPEVLALKMGDLGCAASLAGLTLALHLVDADAASPRVLVLAESRHNGNRAALVAERVASSFAPT